MEESIEFRGAVEFRKGRLIFQPHGKALRIFRTGTRMAQGFERTLSVAVHRFNYRHIEQRPDGIRIGVAGQFEVIEGVS